MDSKSRAALQPIYRLLPPGFSGEQFDDFINFAYDGKSECRVVRFVGPGRCMVLFSYPNGLTARYGHQDYRMLFLHEDGRYVEFDPKTIEAQWKPSSRHQLYFPWDREVGAWLEKNGAQQFRGTNWAGHISAKLVTVLRDWRDKFSGLPAEE